MAGHSTEDPEVQALSDEEFEAALRKQDILFLNDGPRLVVPVERT